MRIACYARTSLDLHTDSIENQFAIMESCIWVQRSSALQIRDRAASTRSVRRSKSCWHKSASAASTAS